MTDAPKLGLDQCTEIMKEHGGKMTTALATLLLACQLQVANAQSVPRVVGPGEHRTDIIGAGELPKNVIVLPGGTATTKKSDDKGTTWTVTASVSTSASAAADKGGGQVVKIDGKEYTFSGIASMDSAERKQLQILKKLGELGILKEYQEWSSRELEAANQEGNQFAEKKQAAIEKIVKQIPQVVPLYEADIAKGIKIPITDKKSLEFAIKIGEPKEWIPRIKKILENPQNFA